MRRQDGTGLQALLLSIVHSLQMARCLPMYCSSVAADSMHSTSGVSSRVWALDIASEDCKGHLNHPEPEIPLSGPSLCVFWESRFTLETVLLLCRLKDKGVGRDGEWGSLLDKPPLCQASAEDSPTLSHLLSIFMERHWLLWKVRSGCCIEVAAVSIVCFVAVSACTASPLSSSGCHAR